MALARAVWDGAPGGAVMRADGYEATLAMLRVLARARLPGAEAAQAAARRWPGSIDAGLLAVRLADPAGRDAALAELEARVRAANRRRAAVAEGWLHWGEPARARAALAEIDPRSDTARADIARRAALAIEAGDFDAAARDLEPDMLALQARLIYRRDGAAALGAHLAQAQGGAALWSEAFALLLAERDFTRLPWVLARWREGASDAAVARAEARLALERGDADAALAGLRARLDTGAPWGWAAADHALWLRAQTPDAGLLAHAQAACRVHADHAGLAHLARRLAEAVQDWRSLDPAPQGAAEIAARAALRFGCPGRAAGCVARAPATAATARLRAEALALAGRPVAAQAALRRAAPQDAPSRADLALAKADLALGSGDVRRALALLDPVRARFPDRMPLWLLTARAEFLRQDPAAAAAALERFRQLKSAQLGAPPPADMRDLLVADAGHAGQALSPARAARLLAGVTATPEPPARGPIPPRIAHYWEGAASPAIARAQDRWAALHPHLAQTRFDDGTAESWLRAHHPPALAARFRALGHPALRADLFRLAWLAVEGGVYADLDEYPRLPVTPWLTDAEAVLVIEAGFGTVANNFIAAAPRHPVVARALEHVLAALDTTDAPYPWWHTGPAQLTRALGADWQAGRRAGLRVLSQAQYGRRVSTNLPYPHKRTGAHWR